MPKNPLAIIARREVTKHQCRQFLDHIVVHLKMLRPRGLGRIDIESRTLPEVIGIVVRHAVAPGSGIRGDHDQAVFGGQALGAGLDREILLRTGQTRKPEEDRTRPAFGLRRNEDTDPHVAIQRLRVMAIDSLDTAEGAIFTNCVN